MEWVKLKESVKSETTCRLKSYVESVFCNRIKSVTKPYQLFFLSAVMSIATLFSVSKYCFLCSFKLNQGKDF